MLDLIACKPPRHLSTIKDYCPAANDESYGLHRVARHLIIGLLILGCACGYRVRSSTANLPFGMKSLGIPTLRNLTSQYKIEQIITSALLKEFSLRTKARVDSSDADVDAVLLGEITDVSSVPVAFGSQEDGAQTFASAYLVTVRLAVRLVRLRDSTILWENNNFLYRERYALNTSVRNFFSEENPALERLARSFAASLASTILERSLP